MHFMEMIKLMDNVLTLPTIQKGLGHWCFPRRT